MNSTGWVGKQATDRIACPLTRHRSTAPCPPLVLCFDKSLCNLRGETSAFAIYSKRPMELSKQLLTLVEKTQIFYLVKEFALFSPRCVISEL